MSLNTYIQSFTPALEAELRAILAGGSNGTGPSRYTQMMYYHMGWDEQGWPKTTAGKRTRPTLTLLACAAAGGDWQQALPFAAAVELIHNFSLVHDDIQDRSPLRRGRATVWTLWGEAQAINTGDALFAHAYRAIHRATSGLPAQVCLDALDLLGDTCVQLTKGQERDMDFETRMDVSVDEYLRMIDGKTASLIATAVELGALAAGSDGQQRHYWRAFGYHLGLAFQIRDDVLGIWGDSATTGKSAATDIETRKKSLPVLYALERSPELCKHYVQPHPGDTAHLITLIEDTSARTYTEAAEKRHSDEALGWLAKATVADTPAAQALRDLANTLLGRSN